MRDPILRSRIRSLAVVAVAGIAPPALAGRPKLVLVTAEDIEDTIHGAWLKMIYADACARVGFDMALESYPARRSTALSDAGLVAGEINRVRNYADRHPDMIRIDPSHFTMNFCGYGHPSLRLGKGWGGLLQFGTPRIEYRNGVARCGEMLSALVPPAQLSAVNNVTIALRKLAQRRTDLYVDIDSVVEHALMQPEFAHAMIRRLAVIETVEMHCFVHRSRRALAQPLSVALAAMHKDGSVERYRKAAFAAAAAL